MKEKEVKNLIKVSGKLKCKDLIVISWDYQAEEKFQNKKIIFLPL